MVVFVLIQSVWNQIVGSEPGKIIGTTVGFSLGSP